MTLLAVNTGSLPNDGTGDPLRTAFTTMNDNMGILNNILYVSTTFSSALITDLTSVTAHITGSATIGTGIVNSTSPTTGSLIVTGGAGILNDMFIGGSLNVAGSLTVSGTLTTINTSNLQVSDINIVLADNAANAAAANGGGITLNGAGATFTYTSADDRWNLNKNINVTRVYGAATNVSTAVTFGSYITSSVGSTFDGTTATTIAVDAASAATASKVVVRDPSGNFSAATITASLTGTASNAAQSTIANDVATNASKFLVWSDANSGSNPLKVSSTVLYFNPSTGLLTATSFTGTGAGTFTTGTGAITLNGNITTASGVTIGQVGNGTFSTGTGNISLNGNVITNVTQTGTTTFGTGTGAVSLNGNTTIGTGKTLTLDSNPTLALHAATKQYVDNAIVGLDILAAATVASTVNIASLSGLLTVDSVLLVDSNRVLVKNQAAPAENGIYLANSGAWTRATDSNTWGLIVNAYIWVQSGSTQADTGWVSTVAEGGTMDVTAINYEQFSAASTIIGGAGLVKTGNTLDVVGTTNRITVNTDSIDIHASYAGQSSIVTVGTLIAGSIGTGFTAIPNSALANTSVTIGSTSTALGATSTALAGLTGLTYAAGAYNFDQSLSSGTHSTSSGAVTLNGNTTVASGKTLTLDSDPTLDMHAATKKYVDVVAHGLDAKASVVGATTAGLPAYAYANGTLGVNATITATSPGALTIDTTVTPVQFDRILVKNEVSAQAAYNGIYTLTTVGDGGTAFVLTRATDLNIWSMLPGAFCWIEKGTTNGTTSWACTNTQTGTMGATDITFSQFGGTNTLTGSSSITLGGNVAALTTVTNAGTASTLRMIDVDTQGRASNWATVSSLTFDGMTATSTSATPTLWSNVTTGTIGIGGGLTTGILNLAAGAGSGATSINIGHTNSTTTIVGGLTIMGNVSGGGYTIDNVIIGNATPLAGKFTTITSVSSSATALAVGLNGTTTPAFAVDSSTALQSAGLKVTGAATGGTVAVVVIDSGLLPGQNASLTINAKGSGTIGLGTTGTGAVTVGNATGGITLGGVLTVATNIDTAATSSTPTLFATVTTGSVTIAGGVMSGVISAGAGLTTGQINIANGATALGTSQTTTAVNILSGAMTVTTGGTRTVNIGANGTANLTTNINIGTTATASSINNVNLGAAVGGSVISNNTFYVNAGGIQTTSTTGTLDIGSVSHNFATVYATTFSGVATTAKYADLAEKYIADAIYEPGTVVVFGGEFEITTTSEFADPSVAGVVSTAPAYLMNSESAGLPIALRGKVPIKVLGPVKKGDLLVTSATAGYAYSVGKDKLYGLSVFAKSLEDFAGPGTATITGVIL